LDAREQRASLKKDLSAKTWPCLSLSLNVPGYPKSNGITKAFFKDCVSEFKYHLKANLVKYKEDTELIQCDAAGDIFFLSCKEIQSNLIQLKAICEAFENHHPLGRFIDADLNDKNGNSISSGKMKACFYCGEKPALICRQEKAHDIETLRAFMFSKMKAYIDKRNQEQLAKRLASMAVKAMLYEISLTPKPGLVDKFSNGSHKDMNYDLFLDSISALAPYLESLVEVGWDFDDGDLSKALPAIRTIGLKMETAMFEATRNVNTQKGIVFLMGVALFASAKLFKDFGNFDISRFRSLVKAICKDMVAKELNVEPERNQTHGEEAFRHYAAGGARAEAESGFQSVFEFGLPVLLESKILSQELMSQSLLAIASENRDTNILYRSGIDVLKTFQGLCQIALKDFNKDNYNKVIMFCNKENISPGGSADLLVVSIFVRLLLQAELTLLEYSE
jgi:holo-ACP synthase/triphosphoribosyl-dephospho-CoA synthase